MSKLWLLATSISQGEFAVIIHQVCKAKDLGEALQHWVNYYADFYEGEETEKIGDRTFEYYGEIQSKLEMIEETTPEKALDRISLDRTFSLP